MREGRIMRPETIVFPIIRQVLKRPKLADALFRRDRWGNQLGHERFTWPYPLFERMRADGPVTCHRLYTAWFVTGYGRGPNAARFPRRTHPQPTRSAVRHPTVQQAEAR